jgi:hypothetical protein
MDTDTARALMDGALAEPLGLGGERSSLAKNPLQEESPIFFCHQVRVHRIGLDGLGPPPQMVLHARILAASWWPPGHTSHRGVGLAQGARTGSFLMSSPGKQASGAGI